MSWFSKANPNDNITLVKRINEIEAILAKHTQQIGSLQLENEDLRNKVLRKIQEARKKIEEQEEPPKTIIPGGAYY